MILNDFRNVSHIFLMSCTIVKHGIKWMENDMQTMLCIVKLVIVSIVISVMRRGGDVRTMLR